MTRPTAMALEYFLVSYRRTWRGTIFSAFVTPVLFLLAMGKTVGTYIDARGGLEVAYLDYIAPGVLASTGLQIGIFEGSFAVYSAFHWSRCYHAMRVSPLSPSNILGGHLSYAMLRVALSATGFVLVMTAFGSIHSATGVLALPVAVGVGASVTPLVFAYSAVISTEGLFAVLFRFVMVPMSLFAGVFFPVDAMPAPARVLAYLSPLWHGVELCRAATLATSTAWGVPVHAGYLLLWSVAGFLIARRVFVRKLTD
ncbi:MAG: ABC transporter permease [Dactylosporangium sp.]|nr:ABC transporter permease [Dactylosporangium sp.]NNJ60201.1 ABC transporter permease [Dactylosporangium sp.]